jgi:hypothetical protein
MGILSSMSPEEWQLLASALITAFLGAFSIAASLWSQSSVIKATFWAAAIPFAVITAYFLYTNGASDTEQKKHLNKSLASLQEQADSLNDKLNELALKTANLSKLVDDETSAIVAELRQVKAENNNALRAVNTNVNAVNNNVNLMKERDACKEEEERKKQMWEESVAYLSESFRRLNPYRGRPCDVQALQRRLQYAH